MDADTGIHKPPGFPRFSSLLTAHSALFTSFAPPRTPLIPASGPATISFNGLHQKQIRQAASIHSFIHSCSLCLGIKSPEDSPEGFTTLLKRLFRHTPPTALIVYEIPWAISAAQFLGQNGIRIPKDVSLISSEYDASLAWCHPPIAHFRWDSEPIIHRIVRWVDAVRKGRADLRTINFPAEFVSAGSIGPVPKEGSSKPEWI